MEAGENAMVTAFIGSITEDVEITCIDVIIIIYADKYIIKPGNVSNITAVVTDTTGKPVDNGIIVMFYSKDSDNLINNIGTLNPIYDYTSNGIANTVLTLYNAGDEARVTAKCGSRISDPIYIKCEW